MQKKKKKKVGESSTTWYGYEKGGWHTKKGDEKEGKGEGNGRSLMCRDAGGGHRDIHTTSFPRLLNPEWLRREPQPRRLRAHDLSTRHRFLVGVRGRRPRRGRRRVGERRAGKAGPRFLGRNLLAEMRGMGWEEDARSRCADVGVAPRTAAELGRGGTRDGLAGWDVGVGGAHLAERWCGGILGGVASEADALGLVGEAGRRREGDTLGAHRSESSKPFRP